MFKTAALPFNETERSKEVDGLAVLYTDQSEIYNDFVTLASEVSGCRLSFLNLLNSETQWSLTCSGMGEEEFDKMREMPRSVSFCQYALLSNKPLIVNDTLQDKIFSSHPFVIGDPFIRFYAGFPLISSSGNILGTLCLIDLGVKEFETEIISILGKIARRVTSSLELYSKNIHGYASKVLEIFHLLKLIKSDIQISECAELIEYLITNDVTKINNKFYQELLSLGEIKVNAEGDLDAGNHLITVKEKLNIGKNEIKKVFSSPTILQSQLDQLGELLD